MSIPQQLFLVFPINGTWMISSQTSANHWGPFLTQDDALKKARELVEARKPGVVKVQDAPAAKWRIDCTVA
jgi:hypothetical protein